MKPVRVAILLLVAAQLQAMTVTKAEATEVDYILRQGKQTVYAMPDAPPMQRFWLNATLNKANGVLTAVWGYEKGGGQDGARVNMTKQGDSWVGQGRNWAGNEVRFEIANETITYQWGPRLEGGGQESMLGQIVWNMR